MSVAQQQFAAKVAQLIAEAKALRPEARTLIIDLLEDARKRIIAQVVDLNPDSFTSAQLQAVKLSIDNTLAAFNRDAITGVTKLEATAAQLGTNMVDQPIEAVIGAMPLGRLSQSILAIAQGYTADLITALSKQAATNVNGAIQRAFLGGQPMTGIVEQIGRAVSGGTWDGIFGPIGERAQSIALNEILRVHSIAAQSRMDELSDAHPDLQKEWFHLKGIRAPRLTHIAAHGQVVATDKPFIVAGEELMYPRDPNGSAWNTINCHCLMRPYFSDDALEPSSAQRGLLDSLGISVETTAA